MLHVYSALSFKEIPTKVGFSNSVTNMSYMYNSALSL